MKKTFLIFPFILLAAFYLSIFSQIAYAQDASNTEQSAPKTETEKRIDKLLPDTAIKRKGTGETMLATGDARQKIIPAAIKMTLALAGSVSFVVFVYAGIMLIISQGNEEEMTKFKNILVWSCVGFVFITASYALVRGIMQLSFT